MEFLTEQDVLDYLAIDYPDEAISRRIQSLIGAIDSYLRGAIGKDYVIAVEPESLAMAREIGLMLIAELYENRSATQKERSVVRTLLSSMLLQLQIEASCNSKASSL